MYETLLLKSETQLLKSETQLLKSDTQLLLLHMKSLLFLMGTSSDVARTLCMFITRMSKTSGIDSI